MSQRRAMTVLVCVLSAALLWTASRTTRSAPATAPEGDPRIAALQDDIKKLQALVPDQAAVMTHVGYHFTNLWGAVEHDNWPLAEFYYGEALNNIKWAVRAKPFRKAPDGSTIDLGGIEQAIENSQFADLKKAIAAKDRAQTETAYKQTLAACYSCHIASGKPYLKPHVPSDFEVRIINFDPNAKVPE